VEAGRNAGYVTREQIREALREADNCRKLKPFTFHWQGGLRGLDKGQVRRSAGTHRPGGDRPRLLVSQAAVGRNCYERNGEFKFRSALLRRIARNGDVLLERIGPLRATKKRRAR
jgi:hypothetical protein